jgi:hypothetical protein
VLVGVAAVGQGKAQQLGFDLHPQLGQQGAGVARRVLRRERRAQAWCSARSAAA